MQAPAQHTQPQKSSAVCRLILVLLLPLVLGLSACNTTVKLGQAAADDAFRAVGSAGKEITIGQDDLTRLTAKYSISPEALKQVAPSAEVVPSWSRTKSRIAAIYRAAQDEEAASAATGIGCEALTGQIKTQDDLNKSLVNAVAGMSPDRALTTRMATQELQKELALIKRDGTEDDQAAALWACYSLGLVS